MNTLTTRKITGFVMPVGNGAVGKTTVARVLDLISRGQNVDASVLKNIRKTNNLEFEYITTTQTFGSNRYKITLQFLVPPGQREVDGDLTGRSFEKVIEIFESSIRHLDIVLFTYDLVNIDSFHDLVYWVDEVSRLINDSTNFILLGTHLDQFEKKEISHEEIEEGLEYLRKELIVNHATWSGKCTHLEISCLTGENLELLLRYLGASLLSSQKIIS